MFQFQDSRLDEVSGIAVSPTTPEVVWVHNDSGDGPFFYGVDGDGETVATVRLRSATAVDWEDMAATGGHIYAADIGDNRQRRASVQIYRANEPAVGGDATVAAERMELSYPDGPHDAEALLVHPASGEIGVITKAEDGAALYVAPAFRIGAVALRRAASVPVQLATGSAVAPDGRSLVVRDYTDAYLFDLDGDDLASAFDAPPRRVDMPFAIQAEAVTFSSDGESLLTTHEGAGATVFEIPLPDDETRLTPPSAALRRHEESTDAPAPLIAMSAAVVAASAVAAIALWRSRRR